MKRALLFDLDETLMVEEPAAEAAFIATAQLAATHCETPKARTQRCRPSAACTR